MSAFGNPWGDIDKTKEGAPYVVSDDGWGWLGLAILALVPVVFMGFALQGMANFISSHPIWIIVGYILLTLGIGAISYKRKTGLWNVLGMVATSISFLPILLTEMLVEIPSIVRAGDSVGGMIELLIEWIFITLMVVGIAVFVHAVNMALKWYFIEKMKNPKQFYSNLQRNIEQGAPTDSFLWPQELSEYSQGESFGYLMELRPQQYEDFSRFLLARVRFSSVSALINAGLNMVEGFRALHNRGYSYQDLNDGNFFINPQSGDVLICDNDNVAPYGENLGIAGKSGFMAPEIVLKKKNPDVNTDKFSLAVMLYLLLFMNRPLEGKRTMVPCMTEELEHKFYGSEPVFMYDPTDDSNRPVKGVHTNAIRRWPIYPEYIREAFVKAFIFRKCAGSIICS